MKKYIIKDWMSNRLWPNLEFNSFEDGWSHIYETTPEPEQDSPDWVDGWFDDFYVVEKKEEKSND